MTKDGILNWTLEKAQNDFAKENPKCSYCKFMKWDWFPITMYRDRDFMLCNVGKHEVIDEDAKECKYYTK